MIINIEISGITPLLMRKFNIDTAGEKVDKNLTPREAARQCGYIDENEKLYYPANNIYAAIIEAGKFHKDGKVKVTTARSSLVPTGILMEDTIIYFDTPKTWEVDTQSVVVPATGGRIVRHRPRLDKWSLKFKLRIDTKVFSPKTVRTLIDDAGNKIGLGDFRPARKGIYGRFVVTKWEEDTKTN